MTLRPSELNDVCTELDQLLGQRIVQKVVQPDRWSIALSLRGHWLLLAVDQAHGRLHALAEKPPGTGAEAPPFCMLLRKELIGKRLAAVRAVPGERAAELIFDAKEGSHERCLRLFLYGRSAQLALVDRAGQALGWIGPGRRPPAELPPPRLVDVRRDGESRFGHEPGLSARIAAYYQVELQREAAATARAQAERAAKTQLGRLDRLIAALEADRERAHAAQSKRKLGDLLFAHLGQVPRGATSVTLPDDFADGAPIVVPLDPTRSPKDNATRFYNEHKRLTRALGRIESRLAEVVVERQQMTERLSRVQEASDEELAFAAVAPRPPRRTEKPAVLPYREFQSATGATILVGKGAARNDELTFRVARGSDLWMHTRDLPGAHVVVPLLPGRSPDAETLVDAATLAAYYSAARGEPQVDIAYTLRKHVRKIPRAKPGLVQTAATKTLRVRIEPERLTRLLSRLKKEP